MVKSPPINPLFSILSPLALFALVFSRFASLLTLWSTTYEQINKTKTLLQDKQTETGECENYQLFQGRLTLQICSFG